MEDYPSSSKLSLFDRFFRYLERRKPSDRLLFLIAVLVFVSSISYTLFALNSEHSEDEPTRGGSYSEGVIGTPRFVNPVLAITRADHDLVELVYSGLLQLSSDGTLINDLAESVTVSEDGTVYNVVLKENLTFHDGEALQAEDVVYTVGLIQSAELKSPLRGSWTGVLVEPISERELNFVLEEAYAPFMENLTLGVLPKHVWSELSLEELPFSQHNTEPIGSGPYQIDTVKRSASGLIDSYTLSVFAGNGHDPRLEHIILQFYQNETALTEAFAQNEVMGSAALPLPEVAAIDSETYRITEQTLPRVFSVFINQNRTAALRDPAVREALSVAVDRTLLINEALAGYGEATTGPIPPSLLTAKTESEPEPTDHLATARNMLVEAGWELTEDGKWVAEIEEVETTLAISIATANTPIFEDTARYLERAWTELGVEVSVALFEQADLVQAIIRPRDYQALLFGTDLGRSLDLYPFWHSSQRDDPGLNVALYTNITADDLLEEVRTTQDPTEQTALTEDIVTEINSDTPAIFLFSPALVHVVHESVETTPVNHLSTPDERFSTIDSWHMEESSLWPIFSDDGNE